MPQNSLGHARHAGRGSGILHNPSNRQKSYQSGIGWRGDLVEIEDHHFLSVIDYGSRYPELLLLSSTTSRVIIQALSEVFARHGLPVELVSDNGPQLVSDETETFLRKAGVKHIKSSPRYPCSNGMVERFHGVVRRRLSGMPSSLPLRQRLQQALFGIRTSVNRMIGTSPGEAFFGRALRGRLPNLANGQIINREKQIDQKMRMAHQHDQKRGVRELPALEPGSKVVLQDGYSQPAKEWCVVRQEGRQVVVEDGVRTAIRNRRQVRETIPPSATEATTERSRSPGSDKDAAGTTEEEARADNNQPQLPRRSSRVSMPVERLG